MIDSLYNLFLGCRHRRTSFPATRRGGPKEEMYVVCLDCGKQFHYDWELMRVGAVVATQPASTPDIDSKPAPRGNKIRYFAAALTLPLIWIIGKSALGRKRSKPEKEQNPEPKH